MTRYYVDISKSLMESIDDIQWPEGFRLVRLFGPRFNNVERWLVEDDNAPAELDRYLVSPTFHIEYIGEGPEYTVTAIEREIMDRP
jgi:hypothetical protein